MSCNPNSHWLNETCAFCATSPNGVEAGKAGAALAHLAADPEWVAKAWKWIVDQAATGAIFTTDDLIAAVGMPETHTKAVGAVVRSASVKGIIQTVGVTPTTRKSSHGRLIRQWLGAAWVR